MDYEPQFFKIETGFNSIHLVCRQNRLELRGKHKSLQSVIDLDNPQRLQLANLEYLMSVLLFMPAPGRILMLGTAAGSLLHFLRFHYPRAEITAVDIDAELVEKLLHMQILPAADDRLSYVHDDAAHFIGHCADSFDLVLVDIFDGAQSPSWLLEKAAIQQLYEITASGGGLAFNLLVDSDHDFGGFYRNLSQLFAGNTLSLPVAGLENRVVYAVREPAAARDMTANMQRALELTAQLDFELMPILSVIYNTNPAGRGLI